MSILLLGVSTNFIINAVFDFKYQRPPVSFSLEEYVNAIIASAVLLGGTRWIASRLNSRFPWTESVGRRIVVQSTLQLLFILVALNLLILVTSYLFYGMHEFDDLILINCCVVSITFFFTAIDTSVFFFNHWNTTTSVSNPNVPDTDSSIEVILGRTKHFLRQEDISYACTQDNCAFIITGDGKRFLYGRSLDQLMNVLNGKNFFRANRQVVVSRHMVKTIRPLQYGKIKLEVNNQSVNLSSITVSRSKASLFRKWLKSDNTQ